MWALKTLDSVTGEYHGVHGLRVCHRDLYRLVHDRCSMKIVITTLLAGIIFALGLGLSGMTDANKVIRFLEIGERWDATLAFVMIGAIGVHGCLYPFILKRNQPVLSDGFHLPTQRIVTKPLIAGAALFGLGWGLGGYCPGPALVSLAALGQESLTFCSAMLVGVVLYDRVWVPFVSDPHKVRS